MIAVICAAAGPSAGARGVLRVGEPAKDFALDTVEGPGIRLSQSLGQKATLVVFWAAWSSRSAEALEDFQKMYAEYGKGSLQVIAVNVEHEEWNPDEAEQIAAVIERTQVTYPVALDKGLSVFHAYGFTAVPSSVLMDENGTVVEVLAGYPSTLRVEFHEKVFETLGALQPEPTGKPTEVTKYVPKGKAGTYFQMGRMLFKKGKREKGLNLISRAIAEDPNYLEANVFLAEALTRMGRLDEAKRIDDQIAYLTGQLFKSGDATMPQDIAGSAPVFKEMTQ
jgi:peroxiredoxin